jgi:hypothetical protein
MWRHKTSVTEQQPIELGCALDKPDALDLRILRILEEAGAGQSLPHARRETGALAVMLIGGGTSTFCEFDETLERLEAQSMIRLDEQGFANLSERGRDCIYPLGPPVQQADAPSAPAPTVA